MTNKTISNKFTGSTLAIIVGIVSFLGSASQPSGPGTASGIPMILGGLAYMARKKQFLSPSAKWQSVEVATIMLLLYHVYSGIINSGWYLDPVPWLFIPLWAAIAYFVLILKARGFQFTSPKKVGYSEIEELASLRDKGVITPSEFVKKKRQILDI